MGRRPLMAWFMCVGMLKILMSGSPMVRKDGITNRVCLTLKRPKPGFRVENAYRGEKGELGVNNGNEMQNPLYHAFINAGKQAGYPVTNDYNGEQQEGFGPMHMTVKNGVRCSASHAYLDPIKNRDNLTIVTGALVHKVLLKDKKAVGVRYERKGKVEEVHASAEVILSAGPIGSPHLLQLSGIGEKETLKKAGIELQHELPGVGENLQDHLEFYFQFKCKQAITLNGKLDLWSKFLIGARWFFTKKGLGATNHFESCGFIRSKAGVEWPDLQYHFYPPPCDTTEKPPLLGMVFKSI